MSVNSIGRRQHLPPIGIDCVEPPGQVKSQIAFPVHETVHDGTVHVTSHVDMPSQFAVQGEPVHVMLQVAPSVQCTWLEFATVTLQLEPSHSTFPSSPVVSVHVAPPVHTALHNEPHSPEQVLPVAH